MLRIAIGLALLVGLSGCVNRHCGGGHGAPAGGTGVIYATTTVNCDGNKIQISTGTSGGKCAIVYSDGGKPLGGSCQDGANTSSVNCKVNDGKGGCGSETAGSGSCIDPE